jgi:hypothetical protein
MTVEYLPGQTELPGAERTPLWAWLERKAAESLKPRKAQKPCDYGLFSDEAAQLDLVEMLQDPVDD